MSDLKNDTLKAFIGERAAYESAVRQCINAAFQSPNLKSSEQARFLHDLPYTIVGALNAHDIPLTRKNIERALDIPLNLKEDDILTGTHTPPGTEDLDIPDDNGAPPDDDIPDWPQQRQQSMDSDPPEASTGRNDAFMAKFMARMQEHERIESAVAAGFRGYLGLPANTSDTETLAALRHKTADALKWQLESGLPGITTNPDHELRADSFTLLDSLRWENITSMKKTANIPVLLLDDSLRDDHPETGKKATSLPQKPPGGIKPA